MFYLFGVVIEYKAKIDEVVILSMGLKVFLRLGFDQKYEIEGISLGEIVSFFSIVVIQFIEEIIIEKREEIFLDYIDLGLGLFEKFKAIEFLEFLIINVIVLSDIIVVFSLVDRFYIILVFIEKSFFIDREFGEEIISDMVIIGELIFCVFFIIFEDVVVKETEIDIDREYFIILSIFFVIQLIRLFIVEG